MTLPSNPTRGQRVKRGRCERCDKPLTDLEWTRIAVDPNTERCTNCDRPVATREEWDSIPEGQGEHLCWGAEQCDGNAVDWRARALAAEASTAEDDRWMREAAEAVAGIQAGSLTGHPVVDSVAGLRAERDAARAEVDRLRAQLDSARDANIAALDRAKAEEQRRVNAMTNLARVNEECRDLYRQRDAALAERDAARAEVERLRASLRDPTHVRSAILRGDIVGPPDLVWLHDTNGPVAKLRALLDEASMRLQMAADEEDERLISRIKELA